MIGFLLAVSFVLILLNALFVCIEFALVKVRASRIEVLARKGQGRALQVQEVLGRLDIYLAAIQMGITVVSLALGWIGEPAMAELLAGGLSRLPVEISPRVLHALSFGMALLLLSLAHIVLGEVVPRSIGIQKAEFVSLMGAYPLKVFFLIFRAPVAFMSFCSVSLLRVLGLRSVAESESVISEEEMRVLLGETQEKGTLPLERLLLIENLFDFGNTKVSEVMVPLEKAAVLSLQNSWEANMEIVRSRRFTRYPLSGEGKAFTGYINIKDIMLKGEPARPDLKALRRDIVVVQEDESLEKLVKTFPDKGIQIALVANAKGEFTGMITLEDIVEEIIGEVHDEYDLPQAWSLMDVVPAAAVAVQMAAADRREAVALLIAKLKAACPELNDKEAFEAVWEREAKFSSAVGRGVAVPHARLSSLERAMVAVGRFARPLPFPAPDTAPVRLVFLILTPAQTPLLQLKILARIAALATNENLRRKLMRCKSSEAMLEILRTADTLLAA